MANCKKRIQTDSIPRDLMQRWGPKRRPPLPDEAPPVCSEAIRILRLPQVLNVTGLAKTKIYELQSQGTFPMRVQITSHSVGWIEHEVQAWLATRAAARSDARRETVANLKTPDDIRKRQAHLKQKFLEALGGFPEKTPLNAKVVGVIHREGFRVEKVTFNERFSQRGLRARVTARANRRPAAYEARLSHLFPLDELTFRLRVLKD